MHNTNSTTPEPSEEWRPIPSTHGLYEASSLGRIRYVGPRRRGCKTGAIKAQTKNADGYMSSSFKLPGEKSRRIFTHRMVAEAFHGPAPAWSNVCEHLDDNPANNTPGNLMWSTHLVNLGRPRRRLLMSQSIQKHHAAKRLLVAT